MEKKYLIDNPKLIAEWNYEKNIDLDPSKLTLGSNKKVWWICSKGHEWEAVIANRIKGTGCPFCSGRYAVKGVNDLQTINPTLAAEWNYERNGELTPTNVTSGSNKKVWWKCDKGHEWQATINNRSKGNKCPTCNSEQNTSLPEFVIEYYLKKCGFEIMHSYKKNGYELDVYIPSKKIGIEYDGYFWHKNKSDKDIEKNAKCKKDGIKLYRIREGLTSLNDSSIDYTIQKNQKDFPEILKKILKEITKTDVDIDLERDNFEIENLREYTEKENSLISSNPTLAKEWNYEKNGNLKPELLSSNSRKIIWWICQEGHEWQSSINHRTNGTNCPYCSGQKVLEGYNDLSKINPVLAKEWNYDKNGDLIPENITANSGKKVWWKCKNGHEWQAKIYSRNNGSKCPYCSGRYAIKGKNDLQTINPNLAKEWNYIKNGGLTPIDVLPNSHKKVWWKCKNGHEWQATIDHRNNGRGCPYCSGRKN